jgi:hypothetical protein
MSIGSRVYHKRYKWQVGTVVAFGPSLDSVYVLWQGFFYSPSVLEQLSDLRTTPIQPEVFA